MDKPASYSLLCLPWDDQMIALPQTNHHNHLQHPNLLIFVLELMPWTVAVGPTLSDNRCAARVHTLHGRKHTKAMYTLCCRQFQYVVCTAHFKYFLTPGMYRRAHMYCPCMYTLGLALQQLLLCDSATLCCIYE
jgi:hypothetical protein